MSPIKVVFEQVLTLESQEDGGAALVARLENGGKMFVRVQSYDESTEHQVFKSFVGQWVRVTVEVLAPEQERKIEAAAQLKPTDVAELGYTVISSCGRIETDALGNVRERHPKPSFYPPPPDACSHELLSWLDLFVRFDIEEYQAWCKKYGLHLQLGHSVDILFLGVWMSDGTYMSPLDGPRERFAEDSLKGKV